MRKDKRYIVYVHENKINHMVYVGITSHSDHNMRWRNGNGYKGTYFYNAIQKYGWDGFTHKVVMEGLTQEEAFQAEKRLIKELRASDRRYGYNIADGGQFPGQAAFDALEKCHKDSMVKVVRLNDGNIIFSNAVVVPFFQIFIIAGMPIIHKIHRLYELCFPVLQNCYCCIPLVKM